MNSVGSGRGASFADICYQHTFAGCGCGMCKDGDVCPTPILKLAENGKFYESEVPERNEHLLDHAFVHTLATQTH